MEGVDLVSLIRSFFVAPSLAAILLNAVPGLRTAIITYGTRAQTPQQSSKPLSEERGASRAGINNGANESSSKDILTLIRTGVPHSWFTHYYVLSTSLSIFWGFQLLSKGRVFLFLAQFVDTSDSSVSMKPQQVMLVWLLLFAQGFRRLAESLAFTKPSASRMPWSIWVIGVSYYLFMSVAVWVEGTKAILETPTLTLALPVLPSIRTTIGLIIFSFAYGIQHDCHAYLADLPKYTLPVHPAFHKIVSPHYTAELVLYIALAWIAAPQGEWINKTLLCNVFWVLINLGIVADETKKWSENKFGVEAVRDRARMIPGIW